MAKQTPARQLERAGACAGVGSWLPQGASRRMVWRCKCQRFAEIVARPGGYPTCACGHTQGVHGLVEVQP